MNLNFEKWHGNGNDFVIINSIESDIKINKTKVKKISDRNTGIGFDQLINVCLPTLASSNFFLKFYNSDGSEAGMCLNGIRCASKYIWQNNFAPKGKINIQTKSKNIICAPGRNNTVEVSIDCPSPFSEKNLIKKLERIVKDDFFLSNIGNNHLCIKMRAIKKANLNNIYKNLEGIIKKFNINLSIFRKNNEHIEIRTYENGVGETLSCGSASLCVASSFLSNSNKSVKVKSIGGELNFKKGKDNIIVKGPANLIYKGNINE